MRTILEFIDKHKVIPGYKLYKRYSKHNDGNIYISVFIDVGRDANVLKTIKNIKPDDKTIRHLQRRLNNDPDSTLIISPVSKDHNHEGFFRDVVNVNGVNKLDNATQTFEQIGELPGLTDFTHDYWEDHGYHRHKEN